MLIAVALALLTAAVDVKKDTVTVAYAMEAGALGMSAYLNSLTTGGRSTCSTPHKSRSAASCRRRSAGGGRRTIKRRFVTLGFHVPTGGMLSKNAIHGNAAATKTVEQSV
jgi:hypothetical protein